MATSPLRHIDPDTTDPEIVLTVRSSIHAPAVARAFVRSGVELLGSENSDDAVLLTSEAVTNSVEHADTDAVEVSLRRHGDLVRVAVTDDDPAVPEMAPIDPTTVGGFGLRLIDLLAEEWGVEVVNGDGKCVWFEITLPIVPPVVP
ncbi:ATP-binding protein [Aquihabitans daechungensis]|uniref:ATP-binding protein n=1 Tax=Aquihabitans daechungensis TaxID=1052257 RepID=UPI003BA0A64E